jgi:hypothetical protein
VLSAFKPLWFAETVAPGTRPFSLCAPCVTLAIRMPASIRRDFSLETTTLLKSLAEIA